MQKYCKLKFWTPCFSKNNKFGHPVSKSWLILWLGMVDPLLLNSQKFERWQKQKIWKEKAAEKYLDEQRKIDYTGT